MLMLLGFICLFFSSLSATDSLSYLPGFSALPRREDKKPTLNDLYQPLDCLKKITGLPGDREIVHLSTSSSSASQNRGAFKSDFDLNTGVFVRTRHEDSMLKKNPIYTFDKLSKDVAKTTCSLCLDSFEDAKGDDDRKDIYKTSCQHYFHLKCLDTWKRGGRTSCPTCQAELEKDDSSELIDIGFENITLGSLVRILAEKKGYSYMVNKELSAIKLPSLKTYKPMSVARAWEILLTLLDMNGFSHTITGDLHKFVEVKDAASESYPFFSSLDGVRPEMLPESDQVIRYVYFLKNIKMDMAKQIIGEFMKERPITIGENNILVLQDKSRKIKQVMRVIEELDVGGMRQSITIMNLKYTEPESIARLLADEILNNSRGGGGRIQFFSPHKKNMKYFSSDVKIIPYPQKRSLIFIGQRSEIDRIVHFVKLVLDVEIGEAKSRVHIKEIKHHSPSEIQGMLEKLMTKAGTEYFKDVVIHAESPPGGGGYGSSDSGGAGSRLVVACNSEDWRRISDFVDKVDKPQLTLAIEVMIIDAKVDMQRQLGAHVRDARDGLINTNIALQQNTLFSDGVNSGSNGRNFPLSGADGSLGETVINIGPDPHIFSGGAWATIRALATKTNSAIIYQPFLSTNNNQRTTWRSSENQQTDGEIRSSGQKTILGRTRVSANTSIDLTPRVNRDGVMEMEVKINVAEFIPKVNGQPETTDRAINTKATLALGEVLALGGFDKSSLARNNYSIPVLSSIPIVGNLFKTNLKSSEKSQIYVFIRASAIKQQLFSEPDDYTALKLQYAKYQIDNINNYARSGDPVERYFFKPRKSTIKETVDDYKNNRFSLIDDFIEAKTDPISASMSTDSYYTSSQLKKSRTKLENFWESDEQKTERKTMEAKLKTRKRPGFLTVKEVSVDSALAGEATLATRE